LLGFATTVLTSSRRIRCDVRHRCLCHVDALAFDATTFPTCPEGIRIRGLSLALGGRSFAACYHLAGVSMTNMSRVVQQLKRERDRAQKEVQRIDAALAALGSVSLNGASRTMSADGRRRISLAQKARWAKLRTRRKY
jgi:hypothetical protein